MSGLLKSFMERFSRQTVSDGRSTSYSSVDMELTDCEGDKSVTAQPRTTMPLFRGVEEQSTSIQAGPTQVEAMEFAQPPVHNTPLLDAMPQADTTYPVPAPMIQQSKYTPSMAVADTTPLYAPARAASVPATHPTYCRSPLEAPVSAAYVPPTARAQGVHADSNPTVRLRDGPTQTPVQPSAFTPPLAATGPVHVSALTRVPSMRPQRSMYSHPSVEATAPTAYAPLMTARAPLLAESEQVVPCPTVEDGPAWAPVQPSAYNSPMNMTHATQGHAPAPVPSSLYCHPVVNAPAAPPPPPMAASAQLLSRPKYAPQDTFQMPQRLGDASVPRYNGKSDFADFQCQFECFAEDYQWDRQKMGKMLSRCLTDDARAVLGTLQPEARRDYDSLCSALMALHSTPGGEAVKRNQLHQAKRKEGQAISAFAKELKSMANKAYPQEKLPDAALVQIFISGLNYPAMEAHVGMQCPLNLDEAIRHASNFEAYANKGEGLARKPKAVNAAKVSATSSEELGTFKNGVVQQLDVMKQQFEGVNQKLEQMFQLFTAKGAPTAGTVQCFSCKGYGHFASSCPLKQSQQMQQTPADSSPTGPYMHPNAHKRPNQQPYRDYRQASANTQATVAQAAAFPEDVNGLNY